MGLDRFANFLLKSINTEGIEKLNIKNNIWFKFFNILRNNIN